MPNERGLNYSYCFDWILNYYSIYFQGDPDKKSQAFPHIQQGDHTTKFLTKCKSLLEAKLNW